LPRSLRYVGRRSQTERKKKPAHFGRDDRLAALAHRLALPGRVRDATGFRLIGYVVMPEHVHLLISEPREGTPSTVLHKLKLGVARKLRKRKRACAGQLRLPFAAPREPLRAFWQARFYDFNVYSRGKKREKLNYMHANPVKRGLVNHPRDWAWSSWAYYFSGEKPLLPMDV
jgi:REP element-mobilizing transposase RayT